MQVDESCAQSEQVQDADSKVHFVSDPTRRLVCDHRSKGFILSHSDFTRHRKLLRFAFGGKACQHCVLPFGLALAPQTFTKSMDAALAPLWLQGIRILNYLDGWLAHTQDQALTHRDLVLDHLRSLGLQTNLQKSVLLPSQQQPFCGSH